MRLFLVIFDRETSTVEVRPIEDADVAVGELFEIEDRLREGDGRFEIVLMTAADEDDLRRTHSRFFESLDQLLEPA